MQRRASISTHLGLGLSLLLSSACSDDTTAATTASSAAEDPSSGSSSDSDSDATGSSGVDESESESDTADEVGESESGSDTDTDTDTDTGEPGPNCGDGVLDPGEECDDGNNADGDGCSNACVSDCGAAFWLDVNAPEGWFDIQDMRSGEDGVIHLAGNLDFNDATPGRVRLASYAGEELLGALESQALGSAGTVQLPQTHAAEAVVITAQGDLLALGTSTEVLVEGDAPARSYWLARFAAEDLASVWRIDLPAPASNELRPLGLAALDNGDAVLTMTTEVADNDDDITVMRRAFADGAEQWTASQSGAFDGGYSLDSAGLISVGPDGRLWTAGIIRADWQTYETTVFELDPADGALLWSDVPLPDPGNAHEQRVYALDAGPAGRVAVGIAVQGPALQYSYGFAALYDEHELAWTLAPEDLPWDEGEPYLAPRVALDSDGDVLVSGTYTHSFNFATASRTWVTAYAADGTQLCNARLGMGGDAGIPPANGFFGGGQGAINIDTYGVGGMGPGSDGNWMVGLRGWP